MQWVKNWVPTTFDIFHVTECSTYYFLQVAFNTDPAAKREYPSLLVIISCFEDWLTDNDLKSDCVACCIGIRTGEGL